MNRSFFVVSAVVVIILALVGVYGWQRRTVSAAASAVRVQTAAVERGTIAATVSAAGNVSTVKSTSLTFQTSGKVAQVNVQVGDQVKANQLLMELDPSDLELALKTSRTNLVKEQANYEQTKTQLGFALRNAQATLVSSKANLDAAKAKNEQSPNSIIVAKASLDKATVALQQAQGEYNKIAWRGDVGMTSQAAALQQATIDYNSARANYDITAATINDSALKQAQTQYAKDQVAFEQAQLNLDTDLRVAQAQLDNVKVAVEQAQRNRDKAKILAPYDGYIATVSLNPGDTAGTNTAAIVMADLKTLQVKVTIAEVDIEKIKIGQSAQVTLDALAGKTYTGQLVALGPVGTVTQGVVNYPVTFSVTNTDGAIKPGMTANLAISVEQRDNVLRLPVRAIRTQGNQKTVTVSYKGQSINVAVVVGLTGDQFAEIVSGVREGDQVVVQQTQTRQTGLGGSGGVPIFGPGGR